MNRTVINTANALYVINQRLTNYINSTLYSPSMREASANLMKQIEATAHIYRIYGLYNPRFFDESAVDEEDITARNGTDYETLDTENSNGADDNSMEE